MSRNAPFALVLCALAGMAEAQVPAGPEFRVNAYTTRIQARAAVAARRDGSFVVTWHGYDGLNSSFDVAGRLFNAAGTPIGAEFVVHTFLPGFQAYPHVGTDGRGGFVVAWEDPANNGVLARRFRPSGAPLGAEFVVDDFPTNSTGESALAVHADGRFVVVWQELARDGDGYGIFGRRFDASGAPVGASFQVNAFTTANQRRPRAAMTPDGGFVVAWDSPDAFANGVWLRRFDAAGVPLALEQEAATASLSQFVPDVAAARDGTFVVAWTSYSQDGSHNGIFGRRFSAAGAPVGGEFRVNTYTVNAQDRARVAMDAGGSFAVTWESVGQDGELFGVFGQRYTADAVPRGAEFRVNTYTTASQRLPSLAGDGRGNLIAAWDSFGQDGAQEGIYAQRVGGLFPAALSVVDGGNNVLEVPDDFFLSTSWRNVSGGPQTFTGQAVDFTGPAGLVYVMGSMTANYGTVADGASQACSGSCLSGSLLGARPTGHVDVFFRERIVPDAQGQEQRWVLHVGDSFSDVARSNVFYRFVETLLHHGVTSGCSATQYCPASSTTREQMAVFVLVAKEGSGYSPAACTPPNLFADVPETSAFCRWIEELAARGVVNGCGGGNYCPSAAVTREQMAVFVLRTLDPTFTPPACTTPQFPDVPPSSPFCPWIEELARRGVVTGCGGGNFCPGLPVTREQMGVFLTVTFGLSLYGP